MKYPPINKFMKCIAFLNVNQGMNKIIDMILELGFIDTRTSGLVNSLSHFTLFRKLVKSQLDILEI